jgi:hypothetical protein
VKLFSVLSTALLVTAVVTTAGRSPLATAQTSIAQTSRPQLLPFFDTESNPVPVDFPANTLKDITPAPPTAAAFDNRVLELCGTGFDAPVSKQAFRTLLRDYPDVLQRLKTVTDGELKPNRRSDDEFFNDLVGVWFDRQGFKHIFCGEVTSGGSDTIGGLHWHVRYLQLQEAGIGGRIVGKVGDRDTIEEVVDGVIYTFGTAIQEGDRLVAQHRVKGYAYVLNAEELLLHTTKAFKLSGAVRSSGNAACLYTVNDPEAAPFKAVFVARSKAIVTFYPDATPDVGGTRGCGG